MEQTIKKLITLSISQKILNQNKNPIRNLNEPEELN